MSSQGLNSGQVCLNELKAVFEVNVMTLFMEEVWNACPDQCTEVPDSLFHTTKMFSFHPYVIKAEKYGINRPG